MTDHQHPTPIPTPPVELCLTILAHPYPERVGQVLCLSPDNQTSGERGRHWRVSRHEGAFHDPYQPASAQPLEPRPERAFNEFVSKTRPLCISFNPDASDTKVKVWIGFDESDCGCRLPVPAYHTLYATPSAARLDTPPGPATVDPDERELARRLHPVHDPRIYASSEIERGIVLLYGRHVSLVLHRWTPFAAEDARLRQRIAQLVGKPLSARQKDGLRFGGFVGESGPFRQLLRRLVKVSTQVEPASQGGTRLVPVLLLGETGTGKLPASQLIHFLSERQGPWVFDDLSGQPLDPAFMRMRLFGHMDKGRRGFELKPGLADRSEGGTLVFDEIANASDQAQEILLAFAQHGMVRPEGSAREHFVDVRVAAATNKSEEEIKQDLGARFRVIVRLPPLRERKDDIGRLLLSDLRSRIASSAETANEPPAGHSSWSALLDEPGKDGPWLPAALVAVLASAPLKLNFRDIERLSTEAVMTFADQPACSLAACIGTFWPGPAAGDQGEPPPAGGWTPERLVKRFEELGWSLADLERESSIHGQSLRRLLSAGHYEFLDERDEEVCKLLLQLAPSPGHEKELLIEALVPKLRASSQAIRGYLKKNEEWLIESSVPKDWIFVLRFGAKGSSSAPPAPPTSPPPVP